MNQAWHLGNKNKDNKKKKTETISSNGAKLEQIKMVGV